MSEDKEKKKKDPSKTNFWDVIIQAIRSNTVIAAILMKGAGRRQIVAYSCYATVLVGIVALAIPPYQTAKQLVVLAFVALFLITALILVARRYGELEQESVGRTTLPSLLPLPTYKADKLKTMLEETRKEAFEFLRRNDRKLSDTDVRANIFFPVCDAAGKLNGNKLRIYSVMYCNMDNPLERGITFKPKQGATGRVFADGQRRVVQRLQSTDGDWEATYNINRKLAALIHPDLKWIISMPLMAADRKPVGVVNVDGLRVQFPSDILSLCMRDLTNHISIMNQLLIFG